VKNQQSSEAVQLYIVDDFNEDKVNEREFVVIQTHLQSLMQELLRQNSTDEEQ
jgi:hypothetical protein